MTRTQLTLVVLLVAGVLANGRTRPGAALLRQGRRADHRQGLQRMPRGRQPEEGTRPLQGKGFERLVGVKSQEVPEMLLAKAGDPAGSYLWLKVTHTATQGKGMPRTLFGAKKLPQAELDVIQNWIIQGANP